MGQPKTLAIIGHQSQRGAPPIPEDHDTTGEGIGREAISADASQPVQALPEVDGLDGDQNAHLRRELDHRADAGRERPGSPSEPMLIELTPTPTVLAPCVIELHPPCGAG